jgi:hypothetical protein
MQPSRATWTDERLDDLSARVERGFERVDRGLERLDTRIDDLNRSIHRFGGAMLLAFLTAFITLLLAHS